MGFKHNIEARRAEKGKLFANTKKKNVEKKSLKMGEKRKNEKIHLAVTRIRTWVTAATTQGTNHYTITAIEVLCTT